MNGHDAFGISKGLKPRHLKAMDKYHKDYVEAKGTALTERFDQARINTHRGAAAKAGKIAAKYGPEYREGLINNGKRNRAEGRALEQVRSRKYRKKTRLGLFNTEVASLGKGKK